MAFRIPLGGMVVEADTATDVQQLLAVMAVAGRLMVAEARHRVEVVDEIVVPPARRRLLPPGGLRPRARSADTPPARSKQAGTLGKRYRDDVLRFLASGPRRPSEIAADLKLDAFPARNLLKQLQSEGLLLVQGVTMSRRWSLTTKGQRVLARL